jgi:outer membrane protein OmpA-like peptidoglycan-associated protein
MEKFKIDSVLGKSSLISIELNGHCDNKGGIDYNNKLGLDRANAVKNYLIQKGINPALVFCNSFGKSKLVNNNKNDDERALNRRVEMEVKYLKDTIATFTLKPNEEYAEINGLVTDEDLKPIVANISLKDMNGKIIKSTNSDSNGNYKMNIIIHKFEPYSLTYFNADRYFNVVNFNTGKSNPAYKNIKTILPSLKAGKNFILKNMNFYGGSTILIPASISSLEMLLKLMKTNPYLKIQIEGHVNNPSTLSAYQKSSTTYDKSLSENRALTVYEYLIQNGIEKERMTTIGYGSQKMLFPNAANDREMEQNRRVEIKIISVGKP